MKTLRHAPRSQINLTHASLFSLFSALLTLNSCSLLPEKKDTYELVDHVSLSIGQVVEVAFGPDGRLWRLIPGEEHMYVDVSNNRGKSFDHKVTVNSHPQKIQARSDDRPSIQVDSEGQITLIYFANGPKPWSTFLSFSNDGGKQFNSPSVVSNQAAKSLHYLDVLQTAPDDKNYIFWLDQRRPTEDPSWATSLFYTEFLDPGSLSFPNLWVSDAQCPCCRVALAFDKNKHPVVFSRQRFEDGTLEHAILTQNNNGDWQQQKATNDDWVPESCPALNPAFAISSKNRYHMIWTAKENDKGRFMYYANSDDGGKTLHKKIQLGEAAANPEAPQIQAINEHLVLAWMEHNGSTRLVKMMESWNNGSQWTKAITLATAPSETDIPRLVTYKSTVYLSWNTAYHGHQIIPIEDTRN